MSGGSDFEALEFELNIDELEISAPSIDLDGPSGQLAAAASRAKTEVQGSKFMVEQLLASPGSLSAGLTSEQRERVLRGLPPTATYQLLSQVPQKLLNATGPEAQGLRRKLAKGATVVIFTAGYPGKRFIYERACSIGIKLVIIEHPDSWSKQLVDEGIIAKFLPVDMSQTSDAIFDQSMELIQGLGADGLTGPADAVATFVELSVPLVARLAESLGLPGPPPAAVDAARDKHKTRAALARAGLPTPANFLIKGEGELKAAGEWVGFPAVLKPVSGAASLGVRKVSSADDLQTAYREVTTELGRLVVKSGALVQDDGSGSGVDAQEAVDLTVLLEQYLDGPEVDVDIVLSEGKWRYACVADNGPCLEPYFNETWGLAPSLLPKDKQAALKELAVQSCLALGFTSGVFHVELKYTSRGPQLIECNARMGGGQIHETNLRVWGVDLVEETLFIALGIPNRPDVPLVPLTSVAYCYVNCMKSGVMGGISFLPSVRAQDGVVWAKPLVKPGDKVVGPAEGLPTWLFDILITAPGSKQAHDSIQRLEQEVLQELNLS